VTSSVIWGEPLEPDDGLGFPPGFFPPPEGFENSGSTGAVVTNPTESKFGVGTLAKFGVGESEPKFAVDCSAGGAVGSAVCKNDGVGGSVSSGHSGVHMASSVQ
jgi:hypothetical protein